MNGETLVVAVLIALIVYCVTKFTFRAYFYAKEEFIERMRRKVVNLEEGANDGQG